MTTTRFLETRGPAWDRLEAILTAAGRKGVAALREEQLHELTRLYPAVAVDVARARMLELDANTQQRINHLAIRAHGLLYMRKRGRPLAAMLRFLGRDYPRLFRRLWVYVAAAGAILLVSGLGAYATARIRPSTAHLFVPGALEMPGTEGEVTSEDISERFRVIPSPPLAAGIITNNISVAFNAFALGITAGIGTCFLLLFNGMMLGGFIAHFDNHGLLIPLMHFLVPHGVLEIFAIVVAAGAGLRMGGSLAVPGRLTRGASLRRGAKEAVLLVLGTVPMFAVAGVIEGFVTPSHATGTVKVTVGLLAGGLAMVYVCLVGRGRDRDVEATPAATAVRPT